MEFDAETDERQERVTKALEDRSPRLAGMYRSALSTLRGKPESGCESARVSMICHCMRELMTGLPAVMADSFTPRPKPSSGTLVSKLPDLLAEHPDIDLDLDQDMVPVPRTVAKALASLVTTAIQEKGRNRSNAAALVTGGTDTKHPAIQQWLGAYEFFVGWAHLDRNHEADRQLPSDEELIATIRVAEDVIEVRTAVFFANLHSIEDLLAQINATYEES
jgi:hypothetical protein